MSGSVSAYFGDWLKHRRREAGIGQEELAARLACSPSALQKIETGERRPSRQLALLIAELFHLPEDEHEAFVNFARSGDTPHPPPLLTSPDTHTTSHAQQETRESQAPWRAAHLKRSNLPLALTSFIGRERDEEAVSNLLGQRNVRLLTLVGAPGIGKTRLSMEVAARPNLAEQFEDGVFLVELAPITDPALVIPSIATALDLKEMGGQSLEALLLQYVQDKRMLLVLDNFEQVLDAAPHIVGLLAKSPWLKVMVTSREPLHVRGERRYPVPPLELPAVAAIPDCHTLSTNPAVELFVERAQEVLPDFELTKENAGDMAAVCIGLDGLPLAIELAAARVGLFTAKELREHLSSRLGLLIEGARDLPARHKTLLSAIKWSYDLLGEEEKRLFRRMAVFQGGRTLAALQEVCDSEWLQAYGQLGVDILEGVEGLISKSLLQRREDRNGEGRFWMLETIHEYAREKLDESGEAAELQRQHALYFMRLAEEAEPHLLGAGQQEWLNRLEDDHDNIRAALGWASERARAADAGQMGDSEKAAEAAEVGLRIGGAIWRFWLMRGLTTEGREHLRRALSTSDAAQAAQQGLSLGTSNTRSRVKALTGASRLVGRQGDYPAARALDEESLALSKKSGDKWSISTSLQSLGLGALVRGDYHTARTLLDESLALSKEIGDMLGTNMSLNNLAIVVYNQGDYPTARALYEESLAMRREAADKAGISLAMNNLGDVAYEQGDYHTARTLLDESLALSKEIGDKWCTSLAMNNLGLVTYEQGDYPTASALFEESLALSKEIGHKAGITVSLNNLGLIAREQGDYPTASALFEESLALSREIGDKAGTSLAMNNLGLIAREQGDYPTASALFEESLAMRRTLGDRKGIASCLAGLGGVSLGIEKADRGAKLLGAANGLLHSMGAVLGREDRLPYEQSLMQSRALLGEEQFKGAWQEGLAMTMEQAIAYALEET